MNAIAGTRAKRGRCMHANFHLERGVGSAEDRVRVRVVVNSNSTKLRSGSPERNIGENGRFAKDSLWIFLYGHV